MRQFQVIEAGHQMTPAEVRASAIRALRRVFSKPENMAELSARRHVSRASREGDPNWHFLRDIGLEGEEKK